MLRRHHVGRVLQTRTAKLRVHKANIRVARNLTATRHVAMPVRARRATARIKHVARSRRTPPVIAPQEIARMAIVARSQAARVHRFASARKACPRMID